MLKLLVLADDLTGALDTGVQFTRRGIKTTVKVGSKFEINEEEKDVEVLVMDVETRHLAEREAYKIVYNICKKAKENGVSYFYKKTDSALRGNVGSELQGMKDALDSKEIIFVPAFPKMNRITKGGVHYIEGIPVSDSVFGQDPFEPVKSSEVSTILNETGYKSSIKNVSTLDYNSKEKWNSNSLLVFDAETEIDLDNIAELVKNTVLKEKNKNVMLGGCAGMAAKLPDILQLKVGNNPTYNLEKNLVTICGSVNPITKAQLSYAEKAGMERIVLSATEKFDENFWNSSQGEKKLEQFIKEEKNNLIIDSNDPKDNTSCKEYIKKKGYTTSTIRYKISQTMGVILKKLIDKGMKGTYLITGGDTLFGFMNAIGVYELNPIEEISSGCVLTSLNYNKKNYYIITKSGGFGKENGTI